MVKLSAGGAASGAASGAAIGSVIPGVGTAIGAAAGGILGLFSSKRRKKRSTLDKNQKRLYNKYSQGIQGKGEFANLFNFDSGQATDVFNKSVAQPAYQNFQENVVPTITGQFRGGNLQNSSYLGGALSKAGTDVQRNLDAQLAQMIYQGQQASIDRRIGAVNNVLNMQTHAYEKQQPNAFDAINSGVAEGTGKAIATKYAGTS